MENNLSAKAFEILKEKKQIYSEDERVYSFGFYDGYLLAKKELQESFESTTEPVIKWLNDNQHPHTKIIITHTAAELFEGLKSHVTEKYLKD